MEDLYRTLRCSEQASTEELKRSYLDLALKYHPDKVKACQDSTEFVRVNKAWKILGDNELRKQYDTLREERSLAQSHPVQETVDFDEFDETEMPFGMETGVTNKCTCKSKYSGNSILKSGSGVKSSEGVSLHSTSQEVVEDCPETVEESVREDATVIDGDNVQVVGDCDDAMGAGTDVVKSLDCAKCGIHQSGESELMTVYSYPCRCGGLYSLTSLEAGVKFDYVCCDGCSLTVHVIYDT